MKRRVKWTLIAAISSVPMLFSSATWAQQRSENPGSALDASNRVGSGGLNAQGDTRIITGLGYSRINGNDASGALAGVGVLTLSLHLGTVPWISLVLAITFALYGLLRKIVPADALTGLSVETLLLFPAASGYLAYLAFTGQGVFPSALMRDNILLPMAGVIMDHTDTLGRRDHSQRRASSRLYQ